MIFRVAVALPIAKYQAIEEAAFRLKREALEFSFDCTMASGDLIGGDKPNIGTLKGCDDASARSLPTDGSAFEVERP